MSSGKELHIKRKALQGGGNFFKRVILMSQVRTRKRGKTFSYIFEAGKVNGRRKVVDYAGLMLTSWHLAELRRWQSRQAENEKSKLVNLGRA